LAFQEAAMTVSANRKFAPRTTFCKSKRARRFWGSMAAALRETGRRPGGAIPRTDAVRNTWFDKAWQPSAVA
jgi:hypothetical protein